MASEDAMAVGAAVHPIVNTPNAAVSSSPHLPDLDGMRGVLATCVMLYHLGLNSLIGAATNGLITNGEWGLSVDFFFLLSGFVLAASYSRSRPSLGRYFTKRFFRLAPLFLIALAVTLALPHRPFDAVTVLVNLAIIQSLVGIASINFPSWSIPFELFLPALAMLVWPLITRRPFVFLAIAVFAGTGGAYGLVEGFDLPLLRAFAGLLGGFALYCCALRNVLPPYPTAICLGCFAFVLILMALIGKAPVLALAFYPASMLSILFGAKSRSILATVPFQALGRWSYGIYLLHIPVMTAFLAVLGQGRVDGDIVTKLSIVLVTIGLAAVAHLMIEIPFISLGAKLQGKVVR